VYNFSFPLYLYVQFLFSSLCTISLFLSISMYNLFSSLSLCTIHAGFTNMPITNNDI
jgi:hypothetical protein